MSTIGRSTDSPFRRGADPDLTEQHRPVVDDETMRQLRTPFVTRPSTGGRNRHGIAGPEENTRDHERPDRRPRDGKDMG